MVIRILAGVLMAAMAATTVAADKYPNKTVRLVVPFSPGGGNDIAARFVAQRLTEAFGESAVVDNRAGAGSTLGTDIVAKSAPDGYTLLVVRAGTFGLTTSVLVVAPIIATCAKSRTVSYGSLAYKVWLMAIALCTTSSV